MWLFFGKQSHIEAIFSPHSVHSVTSHSPSVIIDFPSQFKTLTPLSGVGSYHCLFNTQPRRSTGREVRKRPLAARTDDDSFTTPDWNTTINYSAPHAKKKKSETVSNLLATLMRLPTGGTQKQGNIKKVCTVLLFIYCGISVILLYMKNWEVNGKYICG